MSETIEKIFIRYPYVSREFIIKVFEKYGEDSVKVLHELVEPYDLKRSHKLLKTLDKGELTDEDIYYILESTLSTRERIPYYHKLYTILLKNFDENVKLKILDLGCGINPISLYFIKEKVQKCVCVDINKNFLEILDLFFRKHMICDYIFLWGDFASEDIYKKISSEEFDIIFALKLIPFLDKYFPEDLRKLSNLRFKIMVFSFPRKSLSGKRFMGMAWNKWSDKYAEKYNLLIIEKFQLGTEFFVLFSKREV